MQQKHLKAFARKIQRTRFKWTGKVHITKNPPTLLGDCFREEKEPPSTDR